MTPTEHPAATRSESMSEEVQGNLSHDLPEWLQEFMHGLADESVPEHETLPVLLMNYLQSREQKWYRVSTAFKLRYLLENQNYKGFLQKTHWYNRAQSGKFW